MYENEEVEENEGKELAKKLNALFQKTSAKEATGVEELFTNIGQRFLNPSGAGDTSKGDDKNRIKLDKNNGNNNKKKGCC